jgi:hypothetical protein
MTNTQLYLAFGIPTFAIITSLIISLIQISGIRDEMRELRHEFIDMRKETGLTFQEIRREFSDMRKEAREDRLRIDTKIELLTGKVYELMGQK